jgi:protein-tyrosine phosphatase
MRHVPETSCWIGNAGDCRSFRELFERGIQAIVQLAAEEPSPQFPRELLVLRFPLVDGAGNIPSVLKMAVDCVRQLIAADILSLVSCSAGMSRSPAVIAAALAEIDNADLDECLKRVIGDGPREVSPGLWHDVKNLKSSLQ